jgi:hypothetical protein
MELEFAKNTKKQEKIQLIWDLSCACFDFFLKLIWKLNEMIEF